MPQPRRARASVRDAYSTSHSQNAGRRIQHLDRIDPEAPDRTDILLMVHRFELAGIEIDDRAIEIATQYMRWERAKRAEESARMDAERKQQEEAEVAREAWVYFIRIGQLVKIGTTINLASRFSGLRPNEVLAILPGGLDEERAFHRQFADLRAGGEYFHPGPALLEYVLELKQKLKAPKWTRSIVPDGQDWFAD